MNTKHLVHFDGASFSIGKRIQGSKAPTLCGQVLELPSHQPFFHDDPTACQACLEKSKTVTGTKYPMFDANP